VMLYFAKLLRVMACVLNAWPMPGAAGAWF
jgi:hypothetical protein